MRATLETDFFSLPKPRIFAHRGSCGTHPENTLVSFQAAYELGARYFELDVHMTRDGEVVVHHDPDLERTSGQLRVISESTYTELLRYDEGYNFVAPDGTFPFRGKGVQLTKLAPILQRFSDVRFIIEIKQIEPSLTEKLLRVIDDSGMRRKVIIASEHQRPLDEIRSLAPAIATSFSSREVGLFVQAMPSKMAKYTPPADALQIPPEYESFKLVNQDSVAAAHSLGLEVHVWTINEATEMRALLDLGVDGIITDFPARGLEVAKAYRR